MASNPWEILNQNRLNLPGLMEAAGQAKQRRLQEMMLNRQIEREDQQFAVRSKALGQLGGGDKAGARQTATAGGDFDLIKHLDGMDERSREMVAQRAQIVGNLAQWADTPQKWDQAIDFAVSQGYDDLAQYKGKFSPEGRMSAISMAGQTKEYLDRSKPVNMAPGGRLVDPVTGKVIAEAPFAPRPITVGEGQTVVEYAPGSSGSGDIFSRMIQAESGGQQFAQDGSPLASPAGAIGIAQVMPATAPEAAQLAGLPWDEERYRSDPDYNAAIGKAYFEKQLQTFGSPALAVAAYNAGPGAVQNAVQKAGDNWLQALPAETQNYVGKVLGGGDPASSGGARVIARGAPKAPKEQAAILSPAEAKKMGLPAAGKIVYQRMPNGEIKPIGGQDTKAANKEDAYSQSALDAFDRAISTAERLANHPGFSDAVGAKNFLTGSAFSDKALPGTDRASFLAELDAMKAQVFLPMVQSMKGMGALSNAEGQKLTDAIGALNTNMKESDFKASLKRIWRDLNTYKKRAENRGKAAASSTSSGGWGKATVVD